MNDDAVSHRGMLKNMLKQGFTPRQDLSEFTDNSLSAAATKMCLWICTINNILCFSDNAGMKKDLGAAFRFHERSLPSLQHGRFGIGAKFAMVCLTLLKSIVHIFTRPNEGDPIKQLTIDYPRAVEMDRLTINPHGIEMELVPTWEQYAIDPKGKGTVIHLPSDRSIVQEIVSMITSDKVENNLLFEIGTTYHEFLSDNKTYQINVDDKTYDVIPIDRLCWDEVDEKMEVTLDVYYNPDNHSDIRAYYQDPFSDKFGFRIKMDQNGKKNLFIGNKPDHFVSLGPITVQLAYSSDWVTLLKDKLTHCGILIPNEKVRGPLQSALGGTEIKRNGKVVKVLPIKKPTKGDKAAYPFHENTKMRISFDAVKSDQILEDDSITMDDVFNTQVNKSELNVDTICKSIWEAVRQMRWDYGQQIYKSSDVYAAAMAKAVAAPVENSDSEEEEPIAPVACSAKPVAITKPAAMPKPDVMPKLAEKPKPAEKPATMPKPAVAASSSTPSNQIIPKPAVVVSVSLPADESSSAAASQPVAPSHPVAPLQPVAPSHPVAPVQEQVTSVTQVPAHIRSTSKCPRDVIKLLESIYTTYGPQLNAIYEKAESTTRPKLVDDYNALLRIEDLLKEFSNNE
jgi:hypothetical protein